MDAQTQKVIMDAQTQKVLTGTDPMLASVKIATGLQ